MESALPNLGKLRLDYLHTFRILVQCKNFSETAISLGKSQSAISQQIKEIEDALGIGLIKRSSKKFELTPEGHLVYENVCQIFDQLTQLSTELQIRKGYSVSKFQIAASSIPGEIILPPLCSEFLHNFPGTEIQLAISNSQNAIRQLLRGDVHLCAVGGLFEQDQEQIIRSFLGADEIKILARINHPILSEISAFGEKVSQKILISELAKYPWIFREEGSATRRWFMENFPGARQFTVALEFQNNFAIINALENSNALTALSTHLIPGMISGRQIQVIENPLLPSIKREFYILRLKDQKLASAEQQFWDFLYTLKK